MNRSEVVFRTYDALQADVIEASFRASDIGYQRTGLRHAASIGAGQSIFEQAFAVDESDVERARILVAKACARAEPSAHLSEDRSWLRRLVRPFVRVWLLGFTGLCFAVVVKYLCISARMAGIPSAELTNLDYVPSASILSGVVLALIPSRYRVAVLATVAAGILLSAIFLARV